MWALRATIRPAAWLSRVVLGRRAPRPAPPLLVCPERAFAAFDPGDLKGRGGGGRGPPADGPRSRTGEVEEPEDAEDEEEEEEELLRRDPLLPVGTQRVCLVHPEVKWGPGKPQLTRADRQVAEAESLVHTLDHWSVVERMVVPARTPDGKVPFSSGTLRHLTEKIRALPEITAVFLNVERMAPPTKKELEAAWGMQVFDRFTVVLSIFRCNARTKEARLQVALAELPLLRSHLSSTTRLDGRGGGSRYIMGSGESLVQVQRRLLKDKELKIRKALDRLREKRRLLERQRRRREFPVVSMVGYTNCGPTAGAPSGQQRGHRVLDSGLHSPLLQALTLWETASASARRRQHRASGAPPRLPNSVLLGYARGPWLTSTEESVPRDLCGKTTLIKALTGDDAVRPQDRLFATLDVTAHAGWLPSRVAVIYMDTVGFLSQLPHSLIESFSATLEDVAHSDLVVHVRDVSHPETELQKATVLAALRGLRLPAPLLDSVLEVHNKVDLVPGPPLCHRSLMVFSVPVSLSSGAASSPGTV
ncbi:putative GTP-binding protein 6 isoform X3 [Prionailurus viverrinus]|uniref:putative GTP-binding protein 6 isoform X3 n=1 Tax=Prionailurus viverrinus TaxID=61388 RepID=UPI001FF340C3|nr:putative GTP-binding protein 6 isoform X3 [Prionailurus viverrinus]